MILTVTLNAALDKTHLIPDFEPGRVNRPTRIIAVAGGKGINVARVLYALGEPVLTSGLVAGHTGAFIEALVAAEGIPHQFMRLAEGESRLCLAVVPPGGELTEINEPGAPVSAEEFERFLGLYETLLPTADYVALSGSLPPGLGAEAYLTLMERARVMKRPVSLDTSGQALTSSLAGRPAIIKPNQQEAEALLGYAITPESLVGAIEDLLSRGPRMVALSLGEAGAAIATREEAWFFHAPRVETVNPVGSGDSFLAALLAGLRRGLPLAEAGRLAVAAGSANAAVPGAAACTRAEIEALLPQTTVSPLAGAAWGTHVHTKR